VEGSEDPVVDAEGLKRKRDEVRSFEVKYTSNGRAAQASTARTSRDESENAKFIRSES